jgi:acid phosphatase (class A)
VEATAALANTPRWRVAQADAELDPEMAPQMFDCAVGARLAEGRPPALTRLFRGVVQDAQAAWAPAKNRWSRPRPTREPFCLRERVENGAYPDGHAALGMAWALILSELAPDRADLVMARGLAVGDSRVVCGMNHPTDVEAGRVVGAALYAALQAEPRFRADMALARAEVAAARAKGTTNPVCTAERGALAPQAGRGS